jgi:hypothetical protein
MVKFFKDIHVVIFNFRVVFLVHDKKGSCLFALASFVRKAGKVVQISGKARNLNHPSRFLRAKRAKNYTMAFLSCTKNILIKTLFACCARIKGRNVSVLGLTRKLKHFPLFMQAKRT